MCLIFEFELNNSICRRGLKILIAIAEPEEQCRKKMDADLNCWDELGRGCSGKKKSCQPFGGSPLVPYQLSIGAQSNRCTCDAKRLIAPPSD
jgi:hypothetical protein